MREFFQADTGPMWDAVPGVLVDTCIQPSNCLERRNTTVGCRRKTIDTRGLFHIDH